MSAVAKRLEYERELIQIISDRSDFFGQRGTHSQGIDVLFFKTTGLIYTSKCFRGEVKTSRTPKMFFSTKVKEQYQRYKTIWEEQRIMTIYFFRLLTSTRNYKYKNENKELEVKIFRSKEDKWRVFRIDQLPMTRNGQPYLKFFHRNAMEIDKFINEIETAVV